MAPRESAESWGHPCRDTMVPKTAELAKTLPSFLLPMAGTLILVPHAANSPCSTVKPSPTNPLTWALPE